MLTIEDKGRGGTGVEVFQRPPVADDGAPEVEAEASSPRARRRPRMGSNAIAAMVAGLAVTVIASLTLFHELSPVPREASAGTRPPVPALASWGLAIGGPSDVTVQTATYEPGLSSGWHSHTGMHAVLVLSGTLTVYDGGCQPRTYGPGDTYVGGLDLHLVKNETDVPVELSATYIFPTGISHTQFHLPSPAPPACDVR